MWQVSGRSDITDFEEVVRLDKEYITNWNIKGHYQPQIPADLGFYDLRLPEVREEQAKLAKEAGMRALKDMNCHQEHSFPC